MREIVMSAFSAGFTLASTAKQYVYGVDYFSLSDTAFLVECLFAHYSARQDSVSTARCTLRPTVSSSPAPSGLSTAVCKAGVRLLEQLLARDTLPFHHLLAIAEYTISDHHRDSVSCALLTAFETTFGPSGKLGHVIAASLSLYPFSSENNTCL